MHFACANWLFCQTYRPLPGGIVRRIVVGVTLVLSLLLSACSSDSSDDRTPRPNKTSAQSSTGVEPCVQLSAVRVLIDDRLAILRLDTNLKEEKDNTGFLSRYCVYTQIGTPSREVLSITTYRERKGHPAFDAVSRLYNENIPGSVRPLERLLPSLRDATKADVIESKEKNSTGVLINIQGATYTIMVPYSLADATNKAQQVVVGLMSLARHGITA